ncbi:FAD-dependent oxidoreductase [Oceaniserpentilla sp. 4NH20-0058]|uniref:NAD(P)/FAD-dependent oxidoreductase n=1 Tax=Oceaniserpentilla sp. 4NH20-0058 TaxID=3127660 RepID=UPI0031042BF6
MINIDIAVVGAGLAGLVFADEMKRQGLSVLCVEKAKGSGGRLSSKRLSYDAKTISFDLGAQSITAHTAQFRQALNDWHKLGVIAPWFEEEGCIHYVGTPRSSSLTRLLADKVGAQFGTRIDRIEKQHNHWNIYKETEQGSEQLAIAKQVVLACPAAQTYALIPDNNELSSSLQTINIDGQWVMMITTKEPLGISYSKQFHGESIARISYENSKPERQNESHVYCIQACQQWSKNKFDIDKQQIETMLIKDLEIILGENISYQASYVHRWLYSQGSNGHVDKGFYKSDDGLFVCGDYLLSDLKVGGVEAAYLSAKALSDYMLQPIDQLQRAG